MKAVFRVVPCLWAVTLLVAETDGFAAKLKSYSPITCIAENAPSNVEPVYVSIVMHNEEPLSGQYPDFVSDDSAFWVHRNAVVEFADMLYSAGAKFNYQSDWNFLSAATVYDTGTSQTGGKNFLRYIKEDLGFEVDPHAHEHVYNYADVACLIESLGVVVSHTVGGFLAYPPEESKVEYFRVPLTGWQNPGYTWQAEILWGGGTSMHQNEEDLWISGVWKPQSNDSFWTHDDDAPLPHIGGYRSTWEGLYDLLQRQQSGDLEEGKIHTQTIFVGQNQILLPGFTESFLLAIEGLSAYSLSGNLQWVGLEEVFDIWVNVYGSGPNLFFYNSSCGDANSDETINVGDAVYLINYIFKGGPAPDPLRNGDANCDVSINVGDAVHLINYIFKGGPEPCCP